MNTENKSYRTAADIERTRRAAEVVSNRQTKADAAREHLGKVEVACIDDPTESHFTNAKEARRLLDDAERDLALAQSHATKVEGDIVAAEQEAIRKEISKYPAPHDALITDEERLLAVEIGMLSARLVQRLEELLCRRIEERTMANGLMDRIGEPAPHVPSREDLRRPAVEELAELGLSAQMHCGIRSRDVADLFASAHGGCLPIWRRGGSAKEFDPKRPNEITQTGIDRFGKPVFSAGRDGTAICAKAADLLSKVEARRASQRPLGASVVGKVAAVAGIALAALTLAHG